MLSTQRIKRESTNEMTEKLESNNNKNNKNYFCSKENMQKFINENCPTFNEQFELLNFVKRGSIGYVYKGKNKKGNNTQKYAIKFCIKKKENDEKENKSKYQEIAINKKLHHKNVNQILAFIKMKDGSFFSVLEYGKHRDIDYFLNNLLKKRTLSETIILYLTKQILDGLEYLHRCKIIHMDIKEGNILIDAELNPKLIDFSVSCSFAEFDPNDTVKYPRVGTSRYIAPEIENRTQMKIKDGEKIDIYSLGVTIYHLALGVYPYTSNKEVLEFPKNCKISNMFKDFMTKMLERDYNKRIGIKEALKHPWIKGWDILEEEKYNISCLENFLIKLVTDDVMKFNEYIK
jgi:serine/threonine protein kinase